MKFYVPDPATLKEDYSRLVMVEVRWCVREREQVSVWYVQGRGETQFTCHMKRCIATGVPAL